MNAAIGRKKKSKDKKEKSCNPEADYMNIQAHFSVKNMKTRSNQMNFFFILNKIITSLFSSMQPSHKHCYIPSSQYAKYFYIFLNFRFLHAT